MNLETFRKNVEANEVYKEKIPLVRIIVKNQYDLYEERKKEREESEKRYFQDKGLNFYELTEYKSFRDAWEFVNGYDVNKLYNWMAWRLDDEIKNSEERKQKSYIYEYPVWFKTGYDRIEKIEDDIEFVYAVLSFTNIIEENSKIYEYFVKDILQYLKKQGLSELIDNRKTVFIAMSFDKSMYKARQKIIEAISSLNYKAMLIDIKEHNNQIVPEIFTEIKKSKFVVADLTGQRGGVYFEAGYAKALEKDLILCCKKEEQEKVHFDVAQINTIFWENENDLYERLRKRIESTIETETYF